MAKKRERRADHRSEPSSQASTSDKPSASRSNTDRNRVTTTATAKLLLLVVVPAISIIVYRISYAPSPNSPDLPYVYHRGLVSTNVDYQQVLDVRLLDLLSWKLSIISFDCIHVWNWVMVL